jgi:hypothetical protein
MKEAAPKGRRDINRKANKSFRRRLLPKNFSRQIGLIPDVAPKGCLLYLVDANVNHLIGFDQLIA